MIYIYYFLGVFPSTMVDNTDNLIRKLIELFRSFVLHRTLYITRRTNQGKNQDKANARTRKDSEQREERNCRTKKEPRQSRNLSKVGT